jgi:hypothetical protein
MGSEGTNRLRRGLAGRTLRGLGQHFEDEWSGANLGNPIWKIRFSYKM